MGQGIADLEPLWRSKEQKAWNWYDWANSAYYTTVLSVLFAPFMITVAGRAAGCGNSADDTCDKTVDLLGLHLAAGSLPFYLTSFATIASAFVLPIVGALVDRSSRKRLHMAAFAWSGSLFAALLFWMRGDHWQLAAFAVVASSILGRLLPGQLLRDPRRHLQRGRARPGLLAGLGVRLSRRRPAARDQPGDGPGPRRDRARQGAGRAALAAVGRRVVGGVHADPLPPAPRPPGSRRRLGVGRAAEPLASDSCSPPCARCGASR